MLFRSRLSRLGYPKTPDRSCCAAGGSYGADVPGVRVRGDRGNDARLVLQRRSATYRMLSGPAPRVAVPPRGLAPLLGLVPGDRSSSTPALRRQHDLKQPADFRHGCRGSICPRVRHSGRSRRQPLRSLVFIAITNAPGPGAFPGGAQRPGGERPLSSDQPPAEPRPMTDRHDVIWLGRETGMGRRNARGTGAGTRLDRTGVLTTRESTAEGTFP